MTIIAIDGPAGSGKSTIAKALAARLGLGYLDTGAMYRAVTFAAMRDGLDLADDEAVAGVSRAMSLEMIDGRIVVDGVDVTSTIRQAEVSGSVSVVAALPGVRADMRERQRAWVTAHGGGVVEGRDIGSVVFPEAELKIYLTARPEVRAARRAGELEAPADAVVVALAQRDHLDSTRADSPLVEADGATVVDTSDLAIDEVVDVIEGMLR